MSYVPSQEFLRALRLFSGPDARLPPKPYSPMWQYQHARAAYTVPPPPSSLKVRGVGSEECDMASLGTAGVVCVCVGGFICGPSSDHREC